MVVNFDMSIAYQIWRGFAQHFRAKKIVIGRDARDTCSRVFPLIYDSKNAEHIALKNKGV